MQIMRSAVSYHWFTSLTRHTYIHTYMHGWYNYRYHPVLCVSYTSGTTSCLSCVLAKIFVLIKHFCLLITIAAIFSS